jgi:hypothetical protein
MREPCEQVLKLLGRIAFSERRGLRAGATQYRLLDWRGLLFLYGPRGLWSAGNSPLTMIPGPAV